MKALFQTLLPFGLAFIVFSLGLGLVVDDFRRVLRQRRAVLIGMLCQVGLLPVIALTLAVAFALPPPMAIGLVILGACPGGMTSGLLTQLARGDTALSMTLTAVSSVATVITLPLVVAAAVSVFAGQQAEIELSLWQTVRGLFLLTTVPVIVGMALRHAFPTTAAAARPWASRAANLCFALIVIGTFITQWPALRDHAGLVGPTAAALNVATMGLAWWAARLARIDRAGRIAITMECGLQNAALGIFVANVLLGQPALAIPSVVYALLMNISAIGLMAWARRGQPVGARLAV